MKHYKGVMRMLAVFELVLIALYLFLFFWWFGVSYPAFEEGAEHGARIPGLDAISPQGLCVLPESTHYNYAMSGYGKDIPSRVYLIEDTPVSDLKALERYVTFTKNGADIDTHFGGIAASDSYLYIASGREIVRASLADVTAAEHGGRVEIFDSFETGIGNAFCYIFGGRLYAGEFYRPGNYETDPSHHIRTGEGAHHAFIYVYDLDETQAGGVDPTPVKILSVCDEVQGIALTEEKIYLSCSYGLPDSVLRTYPNDLEGEPDGEFGGVPLYHIENGEEMRLPCMSEEICVSGNKLAILFESMSKKYRFVVHHRISDIILIDLP